jgi:hypothetical protein
MPIAASRQVTLPHPIQILKSWRRWSINLEDSGSLSLEGQPPGESTKWGIAGQSR